MTTTVLVAHYYGAQRGAKAATDTLTLQLGVKAIDQMALNSALLLALKKENSEMALKIAQNLVEHDMKHLDNLEGMLQNLEVDELSRNTVKFSITKARGKHKVVNGL